MEWRVRSLMLGVKSSETASEGLHAASPTCQTSVQHLWDDAASY